MFEDPSGKGSRARDGSRTCRLFALAAAALILLVFRGEASIIQSQPPEIRAGGFSSDKTAKNIPSGWRPWILKNVERRTVYSLVEDSGVTVVKAAADASASGIRHDIRIDAVAYPIVQWRWKAGNAIDGADISRKEANDAPCRVYIAFAYDIGKIGLAERIKYAAAKIIYSENLPLRAIAYTWAGKTPKGTIVPMPYTRWFMQVVVENTSSPLNEWITEERNVLEDYRKAFGEDPGDVTGVAIMTNTDNLLGKATGWYGDIIFKRKDGGEGPK